MIINDIIHGDCIDMLALLPPASIDLILTDPPYHTTDLAFDKATHNNYNDIYTELKRVLKPAGWFFCFGTIPMLANIIKNDWRPKFEYIWVKPTGAPPTHNTIHPMMVHEIIGAFIKPSLKKVNDLYYDKKSLETPGKPYTRKFNEKYVLTEFEKSNRRRVTDKDGKIKNFTVNNKGTRVGKSILEYPHKSCMKLGERTKHPTQKPEGLLKTIIKAYCPPDGIVLDPFAGSGSTLMSARALGRQFIGIEKDQTYYKLIKQRLSNIMETKC